VALVLARHGAWSAGQLAEVLWPRAQPRAWESSLKALVSRLRSVVRDRLPGLRSEPDPVASRFGCYSLQLPTATWVDVEAARGALDEAEGLIRAGRTRDAWGPTNVCLAVTGRELLPGDDGDWVESLRRELVALRLRALEAYVDICLESGQDPLATQMAREAVSLDPFRETSHQRLMRSEAALGNRAEAIRVYHRCRELLREQLGVEPSPQTRELFLQLLRETGAGAPRPAARA